MSERHDLLRLTTAVEFRSYLSLSVVYIVHHNQGLNLGLPDGRRVTTVPPVSVQVNQNYRIKLVHMSFVHLPELTASFYHPKWLPYGRCRYVRTLTTRTKT